MKWLHLFHGSSCLLIFHTSALTLFGGFVNGAASLTHSLCIIIDWEALAKQGDNALSSVRLSVWMSVCALLLEPFRGSALPSAAKSKEESLLVLGVCLCVEKSGRCSRSAFNINNEWYNYIYRFTAVDAIVGYTAFYVTVVDSHQNIYDTMLTQEKFPNVFSYVKRLAQRPAFVKNVGQIVDWPWPVIIP